MSEKTTLYTTGANKIIAGGMVLTTPIVQEGQASLLQIRDLLGMDLQDAETVPVYDISGLFSAFYSYSDMAAELICSSFAALIRENTQRVEIRAKTTAALSNEIRNESFRKFDEVLQTYASTMSQLGIALEDRSTTRAAVNGALLGAGLQSLTIGRGKSGAIAGALISAFIENAQQEQLRQERVQCAIGGIQNLLSIIPQLSDGLMDQYVSLIYGSEIDFAKRDAEIVRAKAEIMSMSKKAEVLINDLCLYSQISRKINVVVNKKVFMMGPGLPGGCFFYPAFWRHFRKNPFNGFFNFMFDMTGKKYRIRKELQGQVQPELNGFKNRMEATLLEFGDLEQKAKRVLA